MAKICRDENCPREHCMICDQKHLKIEERQVCVSCIYFLRENLTAIRGLSDSLLDQAMNGSGVPFTLITGSHDDRIPGGDAMVMLAPGSDGKFAESMLELAEDAPSILQVLVSIEDSWRKELGYNAARETSIKKSTRFLHENIPWAARHYPKINQNAEKLYQCRRRLEAVLHAGERNLVANVPCFDCQQNLIRKYKENGLDEHWECRGCKRQYTDAEYFLCLHAKLEEEKAS